MVHKIDKLELNKTLVNLLFPSLKNRPIISKIHLLKALMVEWKSKSKLSLLSYNNSDKGNETNVIPVLLKMFYETYPNVKPYITIDGIGITHEILTVLKQYKYDFVIVYKRSK